MSYVSAEFQDRGSVLSALRNLKESGLSPGDLDVYSDVPLEIPRKILERRTHMSLGVVLGAITFGLLTVAFVFFVQHNYPIVTGGMPIFSVWATGVVFYELTMLGAIVSALFWFLYESGLMGHTRRAKPPIFEPGSMCVRIYCQGEQVEDLRRSLEAAGAINFKIAGDT